MKKILFAVTYVFMLVAVFAQNSLPPCPTGWFGDDTSSWSNCYGTTTFKSGNKYSGEWKDGKLNGQGTFTYAKGNTHTNIGEFKDGYFHGKGTTTFTNGDKLSGEFKNDLPNGKGTYTWKNGNQSSSEYKDGTPVGQISTYFLADNQFKGDTLFVNTLNGRANGLGIYTWSNGNKFVGEWKDDRQNGLGIKYLANGVLDQSGHWSDLSLIRSFQIDTNRFPFSGTPTNVAVAEKEKFDIQDVNSVANRIEAYIFEAQKLKNDQRYSESCNFLNTAIKLININNLENRFGSIQISAQKNQICEMSRAKSEKELKDAVNKLNALMNGPDGKPNIFFQEMLGCRAVREECLKTSNFNACISNRAPSCRQ